MITSREYCAVRRGTRLSRVRGFTLTELLVVSAIAMVIFLVGFQLISGTAAVSARGSARIRATESARVFFQMLERDIASAHPGPFNLTRSRTPALSAFGQYDTYTPGIGVLEQVGTKQYDMLQFYTRNDAPEITDELLFVRYYVNRYPDELDNTICRKAEPVDPTAPPPEDAEPLELTNEGEPDELPPVGSGLFELNYALFDHVDNLMINYLEWKPDTKTLATVNPETQNFTHIRVTLRLSTVEAGNVVLQSYSKVFEIPAGF